MPSPSTSVADVRHPSFRCIACGDLRCGDLLEITYPSWQESKPDAAGLKAAWRDRRASSRAVDLSGVWRFRELLPAMDADQRVITLREGNTPLYELPQCSR